MYPWQKYFPEYRVPRAITDLVDAGLFKDGTIKGGLPNFSTTFPDGSDLTIWVEHPNPDRREYEDERYALALKEPREDSQTVLKSNDVVEILAGIRAVFAEKGGPRKLEGETE